MTSKKHQTENEQINTDQHHKADATKDEASLLENEDTALDLKEAEYLAHIAKLTKENSELKDNVLRVMAEADNFKKRKDKEMVDIKKYALTSLVQELVPILENIYRSTAHMTEEQLQDANLKQLIDGITMTQIEFLKLLEKHGVKRISPQSGEVFDHNLHQAISTVSTNGAQAPNTVVHAIQAGYVLSDRLLKPAMVVVSQ